MFMHRMETERERNIEERIRDIPNSSCQASVCSLVLSHHNKDLEWRTLKPSISQEAGAVAARAQEGLEELFHVQGQKGRW